MDIRVEHVCLEWPLNLAVDGVKVIERNDSLPQVRDTVADIRKTVVDVQLWPLLKKKVEIDELAFDDMKLNTTHFIHQARVKGVIGRMDVKAHGIDLNKSVVRIDGANLKNARLDVALSDTVPPDTTQSKNYWKINVAKLNIEKTDVTVHMPGDTLQVEAYMGRMAAEHGFFDLYSSLYQVAKLDWTDGRLKYDNNFEPRLKGLDYNHIALSGIQLGVDSLYYLSPKIVVNIRQCQLKEKSGIAVNQLAGRVLMDSLQLQLPNVVLRTPDSHINAQVRMDLNAFDTKNPGKIFVRLLASIGKQDIVRFAGAMPQKMIERWPNRPLTIRGSVNGNMRHIDFTGLNINLPTAFSMTANGYATNPTDMNRIQADVRLKAQTYNLAFVTCMLDPQLLRNYRIPAIGMNGRFHINGKQYDADFIAREGRGSVKAKGRFNARNMTYQADLNINQLNIHDFMPKDSIYTLTGQISAKGSGTDVFAKRTTAQAKAVIYSFRYGHWNLDNMKANAVLANGRALADIDSRNQMMDGKIHLDALMSKKKLEATVVTDLQRADLYNMRLMKSPMIAALCGHVDLASNLKDYYRVNGELSDLTVVETEKVHRPSDVTLDVLTSRDTTWAIVNSGNLELNMHAKGGYERLLTQAQRMVTELYAQYHRKVIDQPKLLSMLPLMSLHLVSGNDNPFASLMRAYNISYKDININMESSPHKGINGNGYIHSLDYDSTRIDTIVFDVATNDSSKVTFKGRVQNNKKNPQFVFNALLDGYIYEKGAGLNVQFYDEQDRLGLKMGAMAEMRPDGINFHLLPDRPVVGYKEFALNKDNFIFMGADHRIKANVNLIADDGTGVKVYSNDDDVDMLQDLTVSLNKVDLAQVTSVIPYAPRMGGLLNGDYHVMLDKEKHVSVSSDMGVENMSYEQTQMGNLGMEFVYMQKDDDTHWVDGRLTKDDIEVGTLTGTYAQKDGGRIDAVFAMNKMPLDLVNGFVPDQTIGLEGYGEGKLTIKGKLDAPQVNGEVYLDSSYLVSIPYGVKLRFDDDLVRIVGSNLLLENFTMYAHNENPLNIMGKVDFSNLNRIMVDMKMRAQNYELINSEENSKSVSFGKAFVNFFATMSGPLDNMRMRGNLDVLGTTDVSYILRDSPLTTDNQLNELVKFTDFSDTTSTVVKHPPLTGFNMDMQMNISKGAHVMAYLNADHSNYIDLMGGGKLRMTYNVTDNLQLFGRYTLANGEMKYSLPVIPLKTFTIQDGSYLEFMGDMMNPKLNITATEQTKATVSNESGVGRSVNFVCGVVITQTLKDMGLEFTLDAPEDLTLHNQLETMGLEQRGKLAVSMLTTGMYLADGNTKSFSMNSALSNFLNSEINNITGNALRTLDLSFGMDNSTDASGTTHTDYSFKFAKRFWNNRVKISVGGKISTGAEVQNQNNSFFDNVSLEYRLDDTANKYVNLFFENNSYDWLDGYTRLFGGGFIWRRSMQNFWDIVNFKSDTENVPSLTDSVKVKEKRR